MHTLSVLENILARIEFNDTTPAPPVKAQNVKWQSDGSDPHNISAYVPNLVGSIDARTGTTETVGTSSLGKLVTFSNASSTIVTLDTAVGDGFFCEVFNLGAGTVTLSPSSGSVNITTMETGEGGFLWCDGTNWVFVKGFSNTKTYVDSKNIRGIGLAVDGAGSAITTGTKGTAIQFPLAGTIVGWTVIADQPGSISIDVYKHSSSAPPAAPSVPNTTTDKISASAPIALSSAVSASGDTSAVSTWATSVTRWDSFLFKVTSASTITKVNIIIRIQI